MCVCACTRKHSAQWRGKSECDQGRCHLLFPRNVCSNISIMPTRWHLNSYKRRPLAPFTFKFDNFFVCCRVFLPSGCPEWVSQREEWETRKKKKGFWCVSVRRVIGIGCKLHANCQSSQSWNSSMRTKMPISKRHFPPAYLDTVTKCGESKRKVEEGLGSYGVGLPQWQCWW